MDDYLLCVVPWKSRPCHSPLSQSGHKDTQVYTVTYLVCLEVWLDSNHIPLAQHPLPLGVIRPLVPHLAVVAAVCIKHLVM